MRSSHGEYYVGLDHVRALAAFLVFTWHFNHVNDGHLAAPPVFPLSLFTEGHIGVALFMTLSGYLFAKLIDGKPLRYFPFLWNRALRLFPLLLVSFTINGIYLVYIHNQPLLPYLTVLLRGFVTPEWPNGGWSIAVEMHFYLILPILLLIAGRRPWKLGIVILLAVFGRYLFWRQTGEVQSIAYWTLAGCIDQFVFGILCFKLRRHIIGRHALAALTAACLLAFVYYFDHLGGFYENVRYPSPSPIWIAAPTVAGGCFALLITWYDGSFKFQDRGLSGLAAKVGACSYSIYLLHFFVVFRFASFIDDRIIPVSSAGVMVLASTIAFLCFVPLAYLSFRIIELPPMRLRRTYLGKAPVESAHPA